MGGQLGRAVPSGHDRFSYTGDHGRCSPGVRVFLDSPADQAADGTQWISIKGHQPADDQLAVPWLISRC